MRKQKLYFAVANSQKVSGLARLTEQTSHAWPNLGLGMKMMNLGHWKDSQS